MFYVLVLQYWLTLYYEGSVLAMVLITIFVCFDVLRCCLLYSPVISLQRVVLARVQLL